MDGPPSQSLGVDPVNRDIMSRPPRPKNAPILSHRLLARVGFSAAMIICGVLFIFARELGDGSAAQRDQTMVNPLLSDHLAGFLLIQSRVNSIQTFTSFVFLDLVSALQNRGLNVPLFVGPINKMLLLTVSVSFLVQLSLLYIPFLQAVFQTEALSFRDLAVLLTLGACSAVFHEMRRSYERKRLKAETWEDENGSV